MIQQANHSMHASCALRLTDPAHRFARLATILAVLAGAAGTRADVDPEVRFHGAPTYDLMVTNVQWEAATEQYSFVTFDLSWGHSWRARWMEPAARNVTGKDLEVENWDAAWVFVKFLPEKNNPVSQERNLWLHAMLDPDATHHVMPAGATNTVGLLDCLATGPGDNAACGLGVFIYRDALGWGGNNFKGIKLRWLHSLAPAAAGTGGTGGKLDPAQAALSVQAIAMVYVPEGAFKLGSGIKPRIDHFADGPNMPVIRSDSRTEIGCFTDGSWRGGVTVPFLVDASWNRPSAEGANARRIGAMGGQLWANVGYWMHVMQFWNPQHVNTIGAPGVLNDDYPTGYEAFYCMKYELTQGQYASFLDSLPGEVAAGRATVPHGEFDAEDVPAAWENTGNTITGSGLTKVKHKPRRKPITIDSDIILDDSEVENKTDAGAAAAEPTKKSRTVYTARLPFRMCNHLSWKDGYAYANWAGLRPMSELEFEKVCRGPLHPVPGEHAWGSTIANSTSGLKDEGRPTERYTTGQARCLDNFSKNLAVRVGCLATPTSDRITAAATYWGILDMDVATYAIPAGTQTGRAFQGSHGMGIAPIPDNALSANRKGAAFNFPIPSDWPQPGGRFGVGMSHRATANLPYATPPTYPYGDGDRPAYASWRGVRTAGPRRRAEERTASQSTAKKPAPPPSPAVEEPARADRIRIANVKWLPDTAQYSQVTFDISWDNSWRASWTEPADQNVTGAPLPVENWDAAWVFVKFRTPGTNAFAHATLAPASGDHQVPAGATLAVGLSDVNSRRGVGVFLYRNAVGRGLNNFRNVTLRWMHAADLSAVINVDPAKVELMVHAVEMVYVPQGAFQSKSPFGYSLTRIKTGDATQTGGYFEVPKCPVSEEWGNRRVANYYVGITNKPDHATWPNGFPAFYCMKYAISQGQYAEFLNSLAFETVGKLYTDRYGYNLFTIRRSAGEGGFEVDAPDRSCTMLKWSHIQAYTAWAGLRPITNLEYEKACRGPRAVARGEDDSGLGPNRLAHIHNVLRTAAPWDCPDGTAWAEGACRPAAGLGMDRASDKRSAYGPSYWGIQELSLGGNIFEWPAVVGNQSGFSFAGTHGDGSLNLPADWPKASAFGDEYEDKTGFGQLVGHWIAPSEFGHVLDFYDGCAVESTGRFGARAVRAAPAKGTPRR